MPHRPLLHRLSSLLLLLGILSALSGSAPALALGMASQTVEGLDLSERAPPRDIGLWACPPDAPKLASPESGTYVWGSAVTLQWNTVKEAVGYNVQIDNNADFSSPVADENTTETTYAFPGQLTAGVRFYWRVRAFALNLPQPPCPGPWSVVWGFETCETPAAPPLVSPGHQTSLPGSGIELEWEPVADATAYRVQVAEDAAFASLIVNISILHTGYTLGGPLAVDSCWYWRVSARGPCDNWGDWSAVRRFCICAAPGVPTLVSPASQAAMPPGNITFDWSTVSEATLYRLEVDDDPAFGSPIVSVNIVDSQQTLGASLPAGTYWYWRVRAGNSCAWGPWSDVRRLYACTTLTSPILTSPAPEAHLRQDGVTLAWEPLAGTALYKLEVDDDAGFGTPLMSINVAETEYTMPAPLSVGAWYWRVRSGDACAWGPWSQVSRFWIDQATATFTPTATPTATHTPTATSTGAPGATATASVTPTPTSTGTPGPLEVVLWLPMVLRQ